MHTSGLVLTLSVDPTMASVARGKLASAGPFQLGDAVGPCLAVVMETSAPPAAHEWHDWAAALPGVEAVEVVFVHWEEADAEVNYAGT
jgi:hypothetical protein